MQLKGMKKLGLIVLTAAVMLLAETKPKMPNRLVWILLPELTLSPR